MYGSGFFVRLVKQNPFHGIAGKRSCLLGLLLLVLFSGSKAQVIRITDQQSSSFVSASLEQLVDPTNQLTAAQVNQSTGFVQLKGNIPVFSGAVKNAWFRFTVQNSSVSPTLLLNIIQQ